MAEQTHRSRWKQQAQRVWESGKQQTEKSAKWAGAKAEDAIAWAPEAPEWVRRRARSLSSRFTAMHGQDAVDRLEPALTDVVAAIRQISNGRARKIVNTVVSQLGGHVAVGGVTGLISMFGTASTGTAISSLSGAAATSAQLYWVGTLVGLGATGGGLLLGGTGIGVGVATAYAWRRTRHGKPRSVDELEDHERAALASCAPLIKALQEQAKTGERPSALEMRTVAEQVLIPLVDQIEFHWDRESIAAAGVGDVRPFTATLAPESLRKLRKAKDEIGGIARGAME